MKLKPNSPEMTFLTMNLPGGSLVGLLLLLLLLNSNLLSLLKVDEVLLNNLPWPADPPAVSTGFGTGLDAGPDTEVEVKACEARMSSSAKSSWENASSSPNGSSKVSPVGVSWFRPRSRLVGG